MGLGSRRLKVTIIARLRNIDALRSVQNEINVGFHIIEAVTKILRSSSAFR
jgi:hypothetical protein